jgi:AcrR family transcriptional regulator
MPRAGLDASRVTAAAAEIVDAEGAGALTLARLASSLGVAAPSLYKHVGGLDDLLTRVAVRAATELGDALAAAAIGRSGREALVALADAYRRFATDHPGIYPLIQRAPTPSEPLAAAATRAVEVIGAALAGYGVADDERIHAIRTVRAALHGFVDLERVGGFGLPESVDVSYAALVDVLDAALSARATA